MQVMNINILKIFCFNFQVMLSMETFSLVLSPIALEIINKLIQIIHILSDYTISHLSLSISLTVKMQISYLI